MSLPAVEQSARLLFHDQNPKVDALLVQSRRQLRQKLAQTVFAVAKREDDGEPAGPRERQRSQDTAAIRRRARRGRASSLRC